MKFVGQFLKKLWNIKVKLCFRGGKVKNGLAANLSTLVLPYGDFEPTFAICGQIKTPFFEDESYLHVWACTCVFKCSSNCCKKSCKSHLQTGLQICVNSNKIMWRGREFRLFLFSFVCLIWSATLYSKKNIQKIFFANSFNPW